MAYLDPKLAPSVFNAAWCKFPLRERPREPGRWVRPVLILDTQLMEDAQGSSSGWQQSPPMAPMPTKCRRMSGQIIC